MKDKRNRKAHEQAAQIACEASGSIRTVAALTREDHCCNAYSKSLEDPLKKAVRAALRGGLLYGLGQAMAFWVIALIFWYGTQLVSTFKYTPFEFFITLMVCHSYVLLLLSLDHPCSRV
jgi:ATP-binding cassette subfamily B (MDR/TAP) protein 1